MAQPPGPGPSESPQPSQQVLKVAEIQSSDKQSSKLTDEEYKKLQELRERLGLGHLKGKKRR